jgi:diaminohydroxyphosphoribosylaminopyrimidine deaminase/5-amino-6-(5-phosphoribosylamino)uracil reductase
MAEKEKYARSGAGQEEFRSGNGSVDLERLLKALGEREITSVLVEGGSTLAGSLFDRGLVDKVVAFIAPVVIGGEGAKSPVGGQGVEKIADAMRLKRVTIEQLGDDLMVTGYVEK